MTLPEIASVAQALGVVGLLAAALFGLYRRWWVPGWFATKLEADVEFWRNVALQGLTTGERMATAAELIARKVAEK